MPNWLLEVTDLKQYTYCPRIVFYRYCLPRVRPITYTMQEGIRSHEEEELREDRRSLRNYGLAEGERAFHLSLQSSRLGLTGRVDLAIATPSRTATNAEAVVVEYKLTEQMGIAGQARFSLLDQFEKGGANTNYAALTAKSGANSSPYQGHCGK